MERRLDGTGQAAGGYTVTDGSRSVRPALEAVGWSARKERSCDGGCVPLSCTWGCWRSGCHPANNGTHRYNDTSHIRGWRGRGKGSNAEEICHRNPSSDAPALLLGLRSYLGRGYANQAAQQRRQGSVGKTLARLHDYLVGFAQRVTTGGANPYHDSHARSINCQMEDYYAGRYQPTHHGVASCVASEWPSLGAR